MNEFLEYKTLYIQTSREYIQNLNASLLKLEKDPHDKAAMEEIFRSAHSLKGQSAAMEYQSIGFLCHTVEDVFYEVKNDRLAMTPELADQLFKAFDALTAAVDGIEKDDKEMDLSQHAENLKHLSGVRTEGTGKTARTDNEPAIHADTTIETPAAEPQPEPTPKPAKDTVATPAAAPARSAINTIAVKVEVLDEMMNLLENLLIERLRLKKISKTLENEHTELKDYITASEKILASLQYQIMKARAVPVSLVFDHFPRAVRDVARAENKQVELVIKGGDLELDRTIVDRLDEPLIHLLRNAVSHGIADSGTITLAAERQKDYAQISVSDDGQGVDWQAVAKKAGLPAENINSKSLKDALFSGISTSESVTQISGRGVGLMAIKKMIDAFGGTIDVISPELGKGTSFVIKLPLTLAIAKALLVTVGQRSFAIPSLAIERIVDIPPSAVKKIAGQETFVLKDTDVPLVRLGKKLISLEPELSIATEDVPNAAPVSSKHLLAVIVGEGEERTGLLVDDVIDTTDIVIKPVPDVLKGVAGFSGVTILSDGKTALILNPQELIR